MTGAVCRNRVWFWWTGPFPFIRLRKNEGDAAGQPREIRREAGGLSSICNVLFSEAASEALFYLIVGLFRGVGIVPGWMLELLP